MRYWHGGPSGLKAILPSCRTGAKGLSDYGATVCRRDRVYVTTDLNAAKMYAAASRKPTVYEVIPVGALVPDPDCSELGLSFECERAEIIRAERLTKTEVAIVREGLMA